MKFSPGPASLWETAAFDPFSVGLSAAASLGGALLSSSAASDAAGAQADAARSAAGMQMDQFRQTREDLAPFRALGTKGGDEIVNRLKELTAPFTANQATLEATPGYQFTRDQGLKSVQSAAAAKGLGLSGAALKEAARFATGLADNTLKTQFDIDQTNKNNAWNKLLGLTQVGANAAANTGQLGVQAAGNAGNNLTSGANAAAAGTVGSTNAIVGGLNNAVNQYQTYQLLNKLGAWR